MTYRVIVVSGWVELEGERCYGTCDHDRQVITISGAAMKDRQDITLRHEIWHIWELALGLSFDTEEERARNFATISHLVEEQLQQLNQHPDARKYFLSRILFPEGLELTFRPPCSYPACRGEASDAV